VPTSQWFAGEWVDVLLLKPALYTSRRLVAPGDLAQVHQRDQLIPGFESLEKCLSGVV